MKQQKVVVALGFAAALAVGAPQAAVVYSNLGPGDSFDTNRYVVGVNSAGAAFQIAAPFIPAANATFGSAELALLYNSGANAYSVTLTNDNAGRPGTAIETLALSGVGATAGIYGVDSVSNPTLLAGTQYWLTIFSTATPFSVSWYQNNQGDQEAAWGTPAPPWDGYAVNAVAPAFRVNDTPLNGVPEPASLALFGLGLAGIGYQRRKQIKAA